MQLADSELARFQAMVNRWRRVNRDDVDELVGESLLAFATTIADGQTISKPVNWLVSTASFLARKSVAKRMQNTALPLEFDPQFPARVDEEAGCAERVRQAVSELGPHDSEAIELCDFQGLSPKEAASRLSLNYRTFQSRRRRAHGMLEDMLRETFGAVPVRLVG